MYEEAKIQHENYLDAVREYIAVLAGKKGDPTTHTFRRRNKEATGQLEYAIRGEVGMNNDYLVKGHPGTELVYYLDRDRVARIDALREWRGKKPAWRAAAEAEGAPTGRDPGSYSSSEIESAKEKRVHRVRRKQQHRINPPLESATS